MQAEQLQSISPKHKHNDINNHKSAQTNSIQSYNINETNLIQTQSSLSTSQSQPPKSVKQRNRRYIKLKQLHKEGYFVEEEIMLRYPHLYYEYVGKYKKFRMENKFGSMSQFLQAQIINTQYRQLLKKSNKEPEKNGMNVDSIQSENQTLNCIQQEQSSSQMQSETQNQCPSENQQNPYEQQLQQIPQQQLEMQEQSLIDYIQHQFMQGKLPGFNYKQIDQNQGYDDEKQMNQDDEEKYFNEGLSDEKKDQYFDPENNTGIQDF